MLPDFSSLFDCLGAGLFFSVPVSSLFFFVFFPFFCAVSLVYSSLSESLYSPFLFVVFFSCVFSPFFFSIVVFSPFFSLVLLSVFRVDSKTFFERVIRAVGSGWVLLALRVGAGSFVGVAILDFAFLVILEAVVREWRTECRGPEIRIINSQEGEHSAKKGKVIDINLPSAFRELQMSGEKFKMTCCHEFVTC